MGQRTSVIFSLLVGVITCLGGCDAGDPDNGMPITFRTDDACTRWRCGFNAAEVNGRSLQELNLQGLPNADGVKIFSFTPPLLSLLGGPYTLGVENDELVATRPGSKLKRQQLVGSVIVVKDELGLPIPITIAGIEMVDSWATGGAPIVAYTLLAPDLGSLLGVKNVCSGSLLDPLLAAATVLGGETYDGETKTVHANMSGWITLACAGSAAAKVKLLGYGPQTKQPGASAPASVAARQATLKMITADYCGLGESYTANGTALVWANHNGTVDSSNLHPPDAVEAVWTADGALCLDATRIADIDVDCADELPSCGGLDVSDGEWVTHTVAAAP